MLSYLDADGCPPTLELAGLFLNETPAPLVPLVDGVGSTSRLRLVLELVPTELLPLALVVRFDSKPAVERRVAR